MQVKAKLTESLPCGRRSVRQVADASHLTVRSLQRKLAEKGARSAPLLEGTRRELTGQYVRNSRLWVGKVTYLLGFSDPENFTPAFRR